MHLGHHAYDYSGGQTCALVDGFDRNGDPLPMSSEVDFLTFYWDVANNPAAPVNLDFGSLIDLYASATADSMHMEPGGARRFGRC